MAALQESPCYLQQIMSQSPSQDPNWNTAVQPGV